MRKRVYKFMAASHGIGTLEKKRLKLTKLEELNDPFDLCPLDTSDPAIFEVANAYSSQFWKTKAILCFSRNWDNLLLWSHYGASHSGICLGFDIVEGEPGINYDTDVLYQPNLLQIRSPQDMNIDIASRLPRTKHESWSYEQEVRMFLDLKDPPDTEGLNWVELGSLLLLKEVIIGAQCDPIDSKTVEEALKPYGDTVECWWAGMRSDAFLLVKLDRPPYWHATVDRLRSPYR